MSARGIEQKYGGGTSIHSISTVWKPPIVQKELTCSKLSVAGCVTFLLVEDDPNDVLMLELEFKRVPAHIRMIAVHDGGEAMHYLQDSGKFNDSIRHPQPDVILLDLKMPRINGFEFLEWLRTKGPLQFRFMPVVIMSSSALREDVDRAYALGANSYLVKPVQWALFQQRIRALGIYWAEHVERP